MSPPSTIAHYRITSKLGEGGMGAVYRATDSKLNREVAIKVLPAALASDAQYLARFEREAQVLASLNHPNIAAIYGIEQGAIVMELVDGSEPKGPLPLDTVIEYARQIAAGLEAAHEKGIVHRDLKPANIKVTPEGVVKLLDFGLAKATEAPAAAAASATMSPTLSLAMTQAGMILGTAAYMSPEQARGKTVDRRADIWAFGVVLYEMLTGTMLFGGGETVSDSLAAVLTREPDFNLLPKDTPQRLSRLLDLCLRKDPKQRLRDIGDARLMLDEADSAPPPAATAPRRAWLPWAVAAAAVAAAGAAWLRPKPVDSGTVSARFQLSLPAGTVLPRAGAAPNAVPSPDGRSLAFIASDSSGNNQLWVRPMGSVSAHRLDKAENASLPFWSPDGQFIAFFADQKLKKIAVSGGLPQTVCEIPGSTATRSGGDGGTWSRDGVIVFAGSGSKPLMRVSAQGGQPAPVTSLEQTGDADHHWPQFLPDGRHFLYFAGAKDPAKSGIYVQELSSSQRVLVMRSLLRAAWAQPGYLLFVRDGTLFAQRMNSRSFQLEGEPLTIAEDVSANESNGRAAFSVSETGVLAYRGAQTSRTMQLTWSDRQGKVLGEVGQPGEYLYMELSPDEKSVALAIGPRRKSDVWIMELSSGTLTRMTRDQRSSSLQLGAWSPDSRRLAINRVTGGIQELVVASGKTTPLDADLQVETWAPDGDSLLCVDRALQHLFALPLGNGAKPKLLLETPARIRDLSLSPDGRFLAYSASDAGPSEIFVASFPSFAEKRQISSGGSNARVPVWRRDGKELFFQTGRSRMWSVDIKTGSKIEAGVPKELLLDGKSLRLNSFAVTSDGQKFLSMQATDKTPPAQEVMVILNWAEDLKQ
jgi:eukaryotic-like serine/threonine-protein kinase